MKLIRLYIAGFGNLQDYSYDFNEGINKICAPNGWGKSTFASFICSMFYGLGDTRARSVAENPRKRYMPFAGGTGAGVSVQPVGFLVVSSDGVRMLPAQTNGAVERVVELLPQLIEEMTEGKSQKGSSAVTERVRVWSRKAQMLVIGSYLHIVQQLAQPVPLLRREGLLL